jgi:O-antigen/teichoic acid export membrane protein
LVAPRSPGADLVSSASFTLATRLAAFGFSLATNVILARTLGPEGRGVYAVAVLIPALISLFAQLGLGPANVYHFSKGLIDPEELVGHAASMALLLGSLGVLGVFAYIGLSGSGQFAGISSGFVLVSCFALPFLLLTVFLQGILNGAQRFGEYNLVLLTQYASTSLALLVAMAMFRGSTMAAVTSWTVSTIATAIVAAGCVAQLARLSIRFRAGTLRKLLRFGLISYFSSLSSFANYRLDVLIVNLFAGARQVGLYAVATGLAEMVWYLPNAAGIVLAPKVASSDSDAADRMTEQVCRVVTALAVVAAAVLAVFAPFVVVLFFGSAFADSAWGVWFLLPGIVAFSVARVLSMYLLGRNQLKVDLGASVVGLVMTLALDFLLIPRFGFRGAAVASSIAYTCAMAVDLAWLNRRSSISIRDLLVARPRDGVLLWMRVKELAASRLAGSRRYRVTGG